MTNPTVALDLKTRPAVARLGACFIMRAWTSNRSASEPSGGGDDIWRWLLSAVSESYQSTDVHLQFTETKKKKKSFCELGVPPVRTIH